MKRLVLALALVAWTGGAQAQGRTTCTQLAGGFGQCTDSGGRTFSTYTDSFGTTVRDSEGHVSHVQRDSFGGGVTVRHQDGSTVHGSDDGLGNTVFHDQQGHQTRCRRSSLALPGQTVTDCQ